MFSFFLWVSKLCADQSRPFWLRNSADFSLLHLIFCLFSLMLCRSLSSPFWRSVNTAQRTKQAGGQCWWQTLQHCILSYPWASWELAAVFHVKAALAPRGAPGLFTTRQPRAMDIELPFFFAQVAVVGCLLSPLRSLGLKTVLLFNSRWLECSLHQLLPS